MKDTWQLEGSPAHTWQGRRWEGRVSAEGALQGPAQSVYPGFVRLFPDVTSRKTKQHPPPAQKNPTDNQMNIFNKVWTDTKIGACRKL